MGAEIFGIFSVVVLIWTVLSQHSRELHHLDGSFISQVRWIKGKLWPRSAQQQQSVPYCFSQGESIWSRVAKGRAHCVQPGNKFSLLSTHTSSWWRVFICHLPVLTTNVSCLTWKAFPFLPGWAGAGDLGSLWDNGAVACRWELSGSLSWRDGDHHLSCLLPLLSSKSCPWGGPQPETSENS